jgi:hypothetical protein
LRDGKIKRVGGGEGRNETKNAPARDESDDKNCPTVAAA